MLIAAYKPISIVQIFPKKNTNLAIDLRRGLAPKSNQNKRLRQSAVCGGPKNALRSPHVIAAQRKGQKIRKNPDPASGGRREVGAAATGSLFCFGCGFSAVNSVEVVVVVQRAFPFYHTWPMAPT